MTPHARRRLLSTGAVVAGLVALVFLIRAVLVLAGWGPDPARPVEGWMTPRYLVRVYDLAPDQLSAVLGIDPHTARRDPLERIAAERGIPLPDLIARVEALRAAQ